MDETATLLGGGIAIYDVLRRQVLENAIENRLTQMQNTST